MSNNDLWVVEMKLLFSVFPHLSVKKKKCVYFLIMERRIPTIYIRERREYLFLDLHLAGSSPYLALGGLKDQEQCGIGHSLRRMSCPLFSSVTQLYLTLCNPMDCSTPGFLGSHLKCRLPERPPDHTPRLKEAPPTFSLPPSPHFIVFIALNYVCSDLLLICSGWLFILST